MEPTYFERFVSFVKYCFREKFTAAFKGCCLGLIGSLNLLWSGSFDSSVVIYIFKGAGTIFLTAGTTLTTCYVSYKFDKWKENGKRKRPTKEKGKNKAA